MVDALIIIKDYITRLENHDWSYTFSDDHEVWKKGEESREKLKELQEAGFIKDWEYETFTFQLAEPVKYFYLKKKYSKVFLSFLKMLAQ